MRTVDTPAQQPYRLKAGHPIPFTPRELLDAGFTPGTRPTADSVNALLDRLRAEGEGRLPPHIQARLDAIARGERPDSQDAWRPGP